MNRSTSVPADEGTKERAGSGSRLEGFLSLLGDCLLDEKDCFSDSHGSPASNGSSNKNGSLGGMTMRCRKTRAQRSPFTKKDLCSAMPLIKIRTPSRREVSRSLVECQNGNRQTRQCARRCRRNHLRPAATTTCRTTAPPANAKRTVVHSKKKRHFSTTTKVPPKVSLVGNPTTGPGIIPYC